MRKAQRTVTFQPMTMPATGGVLAPRAGTLTPRKYTDEVLAGISEALLERVRRLAAHGVVLPSPQEMADLLEANLPDHPPELDPHFCGLGPFYASDGAIRQLGGITKQALDSRRRSQTILAMQTGEGTWLYPAWQFTGGGDVHAVLRTVLRALRGLDRWQAGVWLVSEHPDLDGLSPREALRVGAAPSSVAALAAADRAQHAA